jgi:ligand-binding sensor domain-containing protein
MIARCVLNLVFSFFIVCTAFSQGQFSRFEKIDTDKGLSHSTVLCMIQDKRKFLWFGTKDGLTRYDFNKFVTYRNDPQDKNSISHNFIKSIQEDNNGNVWVATWGGGLNLFDIKKERFKQFRHNKNDPQSIASDFINCLYKDSRGNLWIGTDDAGLDLLNVQDQQFKHFIADKRDSLSISDNTIKVISEDSNHQIWIGTPHGLNRYDVTQRSFKHFFCNAQSQSLSHNWITSVYEDQKKNLWIGTYGGGLNRFDQTSGTFEKFNVSNKALPSNYLLCINSDVSGNLLIGSENNGIIVFDTKHFKYAQYLNNESDRYSVSSNTINYIGKDDKNNIWICTLNGGISIINKDAEKFVHYRHTASNPYSLSNNNVISMYEDSDTNLWVGTDGGGLNLMNNQSRNFTHFLHVNGDKNSIAGNYVRALCEDSSKNLWIGTWGDGVTVFNKRLSTYKHFRNNPADVKSLSSNNVWSMLVDHNDNIWIGTYDAGLNLYDKDTDSFTRFTFHRNDPGSISSNQILSLFEDRSGYLWVGTDDGGLNLFNTKSMTFSSYKHLDNKNSPSNNSIGCILEDSGGNLWLGTNLGLNKFDKNRKKFTSYFVKDGLPNDAILGILEDDQKKVWISTNNGLCKFDPVKISFTNFTAADGLQDNEFKEKSCYKRKNGQLCFGGKNGFNEFFPQKIISEPYEPSIVLTNFRIFNKSVKIADKATESAPLTTSITESKEITISYKQSVISIEFALLYYTSSDKKQYSYKMEGFDDAWHVIKNGNAVTYTNLDPGSYVFKVRGLNSQGKWSHKEASLKLNVTPPFWRTWWFKSAISLTGLALFIAYYKIKTRMIKKRNKILEMQVRERTEDLRQKSSEIERMNELLKANNKKLENDVEDIARARVMQKKLSFEEFKQIFPDDDACFKHIIELKWKNGFVCRKCKNNTFAFWKNPYTKRCSKCRYIESATAFTIFHSVKFSVLKAFYMLFLIHTKPTIVAEELANTVALSTKTSMSFKRKIKQLEAQKKSKKKNIQWDDLILLETDEKGIIRKL